MVWANHLLPQWLLCVNKGVNIAGLSGQLEGPPCKGGPGPNFSQDVAPKAFPDTAGALYLNCLYKRDLWLTSAFLLGVWNFGTR